MTSRLERLEGEAEDTRKLLLSVLGELDGTLAHLLDLSTPHLARIAARRLRDMRETLSQFDGGRP